MFNVGDRVRLYMDLNSFVGGTVMEVHGETMSILRDDFAEEGGTMIVNTNGTIPLWGPTAYVKFMG